MMSKDIFLHSTNVCCISDIHLGVHQNSDVWHTVAINWARWLSEELKKKDIRDIVISGDFFHYRDEIAVNTLDFVNELLQTWTDFNIIMLVGNHDAYYKDKSEVNSLSILDGWPNITVIEETTTVSLFGKQVTFCPWGDELEDIPKSDLIFGHFEISSFKQNISQICSSGFDAQSLLEKSPLIISGHFHLRDDRRYDNGRILYLGNPYQMDFGDVDNIKGYYILDMSDMSYTFNQNTVSPEHKKISLSDLVKEGNITDKVKKDFSNNFVKFSIDKNISPDEIDIVLNKLISLRPVNITVDYVINFNKYQIDEETIKDFSGVDVPVAIEEFINMLEIENKVEVTKQTVELYKKCCL
tara:strand:+ start:451 stop:1515 length:1065 start_codon:yes stop_codon:yes gene_type:complete